jgi:caffeoyl-CoA O-methyltransferase
MKYLNLQNIYTIKFMIIIVIIVMTVLMSQLYGQNFRDNRVLDERVKKFLKGQKGKWHDWNVPESDGKVLYKLIIKNNYKSALEIGTSTGHSTIWMAWALSKTGGKIITIEIDKGRYKQALENIKSAGLEKYADAHLADAHELVKHLKGPFDFVFLDADKDWYKQYVIDIHPKLAVGGCFTAHNVLNGYGGVKDFLNYMYSRPNLKTTIDRSSGSGISISYKISE